jgi:hypothetical protein
MKSKHVLISIVSPELQLQNRIDARYATINAEVDKLGFAGLFAPIAIGAAPAALLAGGLWTAGGLVAADGAQSALRGYANGSFEFQSTVGGTAITYGSAFELGGYSINNALGYEVDGERTYALLAAAGGAYGLLRARPWQSAGGYVGTRASQMETFDIFYRGDSYRRSTFLADMAETQGLSTTMERLSVASSGRLRDIYEMHGISSSGSPVIGVTTDIRVAQFFARGPKQDQLGFVTTFRVPTAQSRNVVFANWENPYAFERINPQIGLPEREFLFHGSINPDYVTVQTRVRPKP